MVNPIQLIILGIKLIKQGCHGADLLVIKHKANLYN